MPHDDQVNVGQSDAIDRALTRAYGTHTLSRTILRFAN